MAKIKKFTFLHFLKSNLWQILAIGSLAVNALLVGGYEYLLHNQQFVITNQVIQANCSPEGYKRLMKKLEPFQAKNPKEKKFAVASMCFADWETGKSIDLDSVKPAPDGWAIYPPKL